MPGSNEGKVDDESGSGSELETQPDVDHAFAGEFVVGGERRESVVAVGEVEDADGEFAEVSGKAVADEDVELGEVLVGGGSGARILLAMPDRGEAGEPTVGALIEQRTAQGVEVGVAGERPFEGGRGGQVREG